MDTGLDALKSASKKVVHKAAEATGDIGNKIADKKRKKKRNIERIKVSIIKMQHYKISKLLNHSTVSNL